jgi:putative oxidoreductase
MSHVTTSPEAAAAAQTLFRVGLGGVLVAHGTQKLFGWFGGGGVEGTSKGMHAMGFRPAKPSAVLAGVHAPNGFFATEGGLEYPAVLGLAAAAFTIGGSGPFSLDALTGHVLDRPWMRIAALAVIPAAIVIQISRRRKALASDTVAPAAGSAAEEG